MSRQQRDSFDGERKSRRSERRFGFRGVLVIGFFAVLLLIWFAPTVLVRSPLRDTLLQRALSDFPGKVAIGSVSAGWLSPITVDKASISDAQGNEVANVDKIQTGKNLFSLVLDHRNIGVIRIEQPHVNLVLRDDGSNLEDLLRPLLDGPKSSTPIGCTIEVVGGSISGTYAGKLAVNNATYEVNKIDATITMPQQSDLPQVAKIKAELPVANQSPGQLNLNAQWRMASAAAVAGEPPPLPIQGNFALQSTALPLEVLNPWLRLAGTDVQVRGLLTSDLEATLLPETLSANVKQLTAANLSVIAPQILGPDQLQLASMTGKGEITRASGLWQVRGLSLASDVGKIDVSGTGPAGKTGFTASEILDAVRRGSGELHGTLDVAKLAATIPNTLHLREATHISSGQLQVDLTSQAQPDSRQWNVSAKADKLAALHQGRQITWRQPLVIQANARDAQGVITVDQLTCESSFLTLSGRGTLQQGQLVVSGDLTQFVQEMGQLVDLGNLRAAGKIDSSLEWKQAANQLISITGKANAQNLEIASASLQPWQEKQLEVNFSAAGNATGSSINTIDRGSVEVTAAGDHLLANLRQAIDLSTQQEDSVFPVRCQVSGNLGQWLRRMQMFVPLKDWQIEGENLIVNADANISKQMIEIQNGKGSIKNLRVVGSGVFINEPTLQFESSAQYDIARGTLSASKSTISGTTIAVSADSFQMVPQADNRFALNGDIRYQTDLERLAVWFQDPREPAKYRLTGIAAGAAQFSQQNDRTNANLTTDVKSFSFSQPAQSIATPSPTGRMKWTPWWEEPQLKIKIEGAYESQSDLVQFTKFEAAGESLSVGATGEIRQPFTRCDVQLTGQYAYDLERLTQRMQGVLGPQIKMTGTAQKPFSLRGPLYSLASVTSPAAALGAAGGRNGAAAVQPVSTTNSSLEAARDLRDFQAEASLAWKTLLIQGFEIGEGEIQTTLTNGILTVAPLQLPVSEGRVQIAPRVDLNQSPQIVTVEPGMVVDHVRITPEACRSWMKYVAPLVADATAAEGKFSVQLAKAACPVSDPTGGDVQGTLLVHAAQIGPGPLAQELITLAMQIKSLIDKRPASADPQGTKRWLEMPEQQLNFQLADHRVYHRDLQMKVNDIVIRTQGWVGLDQQLALQAEVPVLDEWVANDRYLASLKGQTIKLPIGGTLSRPQIDRSALAQFSKQAVVGAGTNFLQDQLNKGLERGLDRFFQPKNPQPVPTQP